MKFGEFIFDVLSKGATGVIVRKKDSEGNTNYQIAPLMGQQGQIPPLVAYSVQSVDPTYVKQQNTTTCDIIRFSCDCVEATQDRAQTLSAAVRNDLENSIGTHGVMETAGIWMISEGDFFDVEAALYVKTLLFEGLFT